MVTFKKKWQEQYEVEKEELKGLVSEDIFLNWKINRMPESRAEVNLSLALFFLFGEAPRDFSQTMLKKSLEIAKRTFDEKKLESDLCKNGFPLNRGKLLRAQTFASALMGEPFKKETLLEALQDYLNWIKNDKVWWVDDPFQSFYLSAVKLALLAGDLERALALLTHKKVKFHREEVRLLRFLAQQGFQAKDNKGFVAAFNKFFDKKRNPDKFGLDIYLLELGALRDMYLVSKSGEIDWKRVIRDISE